MFDKKAFFDSLERHSITVPKLAEIMGINTVTLYRKISGESDFKRGEIQKCRELLGEEDCNLIFFAPKVALT